MVGERETSDLLNSEGPSSWSFGFDRDCGCMWYLVETVSPFLGDGDFGFVGSPVLLLLDPVLCSAEQQRNEIIGSVLYPQKSEDEAS